MFLTLSTIAYYIYTICIWKSLRLISSKLQSIFVPNFQFGVFQVVFFFLFVFMPTAIWLLILFPFSFIINFSFLTDIYSSHTSLSFSPSLSEGAATPNSLTPHDTNVNENNNASSENSTNFNNNKSHHQLTTNEKEHSATLKTIESQTATTDAAGGNEKIKMAKSAGIPSSLTPNAGTIAFASTHHKTSKINGKSKLVSNAANNNGEGSYHCQFCDKSFPRLGYLKKHEQVSALCREKRWCWINFVRQRVSTHASKQHGIILLSTKWRMP